MRKLFLLVLAIALVSTISVSARADNLVLGSWDIFSFGAAGSQATGSSGSDFYYTGSAVIQVTDCCETGDTFTVYDNGVLLGTTNTVATTLGDGCPNGDACFADPTYSHGSWVVGSGLNDITIFSDASPWGSGGAYVEAVATPEPGSLLLFGTGLAGVIGAIRRKLMV
jgi:hypothetical protein